MFGETRFSPALYLSGVFVLSAGAIRRGERFRRFYSPPFVFLESLLPSQTIPRTIDMGSVRLLSSGDSRHSELLARVERDGKLVPTCRQTSD